MLSQDSEFDQDLRLNLRYDLGKMNSTIGSVVPLAMFLIVLVGTVGSKFGYES